jgi:hypothetical protein
MGNNDVSQRMFERAGQEFFKETWELIWSMGGVIVCLVLVFSGIYFSEIALAKFFGEVGFALYFAWACSISISALEVAGIKLLGNKERSGEIKSQNSLEHKIVKYFTYALFGFDILTNWYGLYLSAVSVSGKTTIPFMAWAFIVFFGSVMAISEILVSWMLRATAVSYAGWRHSKVKYDACKQYLEKDAEKNGRQIVENERENEFRFRQNGGQKYPRKNEGGITRNPDREKIRSLMAARPRQERSYQDPEEIPGYGRQ